MRLNAYLAVALVALAAPAMGASEWSNNDGLRKVKKIVLFMQENRAFDHYFGSMAGVRGFQDPNVHISKNTGKSVFHQPVNSSIIAPAPPSNVQEVQPFYLNWRGSDWHERTQCLVAGLNDWHRNHMAYNKGEIDHWALDNSVYSLGYFHKEDIPVQWTLADTFTVGDSYYESVIASTYPNRVTWFSGTINPPNGSPVNGTNKEMGGPVVDNHIFPGCESSSSGGPRSCNPLRWKTVPEYLQEAGISWRVYQGDNNFGDDTLVLFEQYQKSALEKGELAERGIAHINLDQFYEDARNGNLPEVSYVVAPIPLSEHPPFLPMDGSWIQGKVAEAVVNGKDWDSTALIYSYDETGGWADHVMSPHAPTSVKSEWMEDPFDKSNGNAPIGPGFRLPFYIVSPWTRGGHVFTEHSAHESQIMFLEEWAKAHGKGFHTEEIPQWRRSQLSNLVNAFDFSHSDASVPYVPRVRKPSQDALTQIHNGGIACLAKHVGNVFPPVPYGKQNSGNSMEVNQGYKQVRGDLTEGRYLTFESDSHALSHANSTLSTGTKQKKHNAHDQLFVLHWQGSAPKDQRFKIATSDGRYITSSLKLSKKASDGAEFSLIDQGNGAGHAVTELKSKQRLSITEDGKVKLGGSSNLHVFSVTV